MPKVVLLDTGPLVALLDEDDAHQDWATARMRDLTPPLLTCEAVLTEACYLLRNLSRARLQIRLWIQSGFIRHVALDETRILRTRWTLAPAPAASTSPRT